MFRYLVAPLAGLLLPTQAQAAPAQDIILASDVFVERSRDSSRVIEPADRLHPGDRVVTIVRWKRAGSRAGQFTVTNPLPRTLQFQGSAEAPVEVSVDGGRSWGQLGTLRIGGRTASPEDVTHIRWRILTPAPQGRIAYSAIVR